MLLGFPLLVLVLKLIEWTGSNRLIWAAAVVIAFQLLLLLIAPAVIMPLFNKFTPLPGKLHLARTPFCTGAAHPFSNRQHRSNGRQQTVASLQCILHRVRTFSQNCPFQTLVAQLAEPELESVLAHEIGHYKKRHVVKLLGVSIVGVFMGFAALAWLAREQWFYRAFAFEYHAGFAAANIVPAMLLFALLAGTISFWFSPLVHLWSRRFEYEADAFARATMGEAQPLIQALRKLANRKKPE